VRLVPTKKRLSSLQKEGIDMSVLKAFRNPDYNPKVESEVDAATPDTQAGVFMGLTLSMTVMRHVNMDVIGRAIISVEDDAALGAMDAITMQVRKRIEKFIPDKTADEYNEIVYELMKPGLEGRSWEESKAEVLRMDEEARQKPNLDNIIPFPNKGVH
jgi:hypothetical protein